MGSQVLALRCCPRWGEGHGLCIQTDLGLGPSATSVLGALLEPLSSSTKQGKAASIPGLLGAPQHTQCPGVLFFLAFSRLPAWGWRSLAHLTSEGPSLKG